METEDPRAALQEGDVATRSAAARDLARIGNFSDIETLISMATGHKSSAVRLYTAAAASAILSRHRGLPGHQALSKGQKQKVIQWVGGTDPGINPPLLMALSAVDDRRVVDRLGRMLRDPRNTVRGGAAAALRRHVLSAAHFDGGYAEKAIAGWFADRRMPADTILELIRLTGEAGWHSQADAVRKAATAGRPHVEASEQALSRLSMRTTAAGWAGIWQSDGLDVLEVNPEVRVPEWRALHGNAFAGPASKGVLDIDENGIGHAEGLRWRLLWVPRQGETGSFKSIQTDDGQTYYGVEGAGLVAAVEKLHESLAAAPPGALTAAAEGLEPVEDASGKIKNVIKDAARTQALLYWRAGEGGRALEIMDGLMAKKPKAELFWFDALIRADVGTKQAAKKSVATYLDKAAKKAPWRAAAEKLKKTL